MFNLSTGTLFASLFWGAVGSGVMIYGWRQRSGPPLLGGFLLVMVSYLVTGPWEMSLLGILILAALYWKWKQGL